MSNERIDIKQVTYSGRGQQVFNQGAVIRRCMRAQTVTGCASADQERRVRHHTHEPGTFGETLGKGFQRYALRNVMTISGHRAKCQPAATDTIRWSLMIDVMELRTLGIIEGLTASIITLLRLTTSALSVER